MMTGITEPRSRYDLSHTSPYTEPAWNILVSETYVPSMICLTWVFRIDNNGLAGNEKSVDWNW